MLNTLEGKNNIFFADVRAEKLFREAEDDFFYFNKSQEAIEKIEKALTYTPHMLKALMMRANIALLEGNIELALEFYQKAYSFAPDNAKVLAGLANIYEINNQNDEALDYIEKALNSLNSKYSPLNKALIDLKLTILIKQRRYSVAKKLMNEVRPLLSIDDFNDIQMNNSSIIKQKLELQKKLKQTKLKIVK